MTDPTARDLAQQWLALDKDPNTRAEISDLLAKNDDKELEKRMRPRIAFGTAGLRGSMEAGFARMNGVTVAQASLGLAEYLIGPAIANAKDKGVVIGHDHRHNSAMFADLTAGVMVAKGIKVLWLERMVHTPLVPFTIGKLGAAAGIMITASHNPALDNGYKVWWENGCQIIPPIDKHITEAIDKHADQVCWNPGAREKSALVENVLSRVEGDYYEAVKSLIAPETLSSIEPVVYTPIHGVGRHYLVHLMRHISKSKDVESNLIPVSEQAEPDPDFSTVKFPNPEEKGALDLAYQTADRHDLRSVIALDPDADRFSAAEKAPDGTWYHFAGNEVGVLLASYVLEQPAWSTPQARASLAMLNTTVSTGMLAAMAQAEHFHHTETLTGFKWLGNVAQDLARAGYTVPYAFEEALGYMFPAVVHDKDGIAAAAVWLAARAHWASHSLTPLAKLHALYATYGAHADANSYLISPSPAATTAAFAAVRARGKPPERIGRFRITSYRDLTTGVDTSMPDGRPVLPVDPSAQMITCGVDGGAARFTVRASGTEPKLKMYVESVGGSVAEARARALELRAEIVRDWFEPGRWGFREPEG